MSELLPVNSPSDIERAIEAHLVDRIAEVRKTALQRNARYIFTNPAITVAILKSPAREVGRRAFRFDPVINVLVTFQNAKSEEDRRDGINPLVMAIIRVLTRQKLGLDMGELLPRGFREVTEEADYSENKIVYLVEFTTHFFLQGDDQELVTDLLTVGLSYFLQDPADDGAPDATDNVTLTEQ